MSVYKYYYLKHRYFYIKVRINGQHISRRFDDNGDRFISVQSAKLYESSLLSKSKELDYKKVIYVHQLYDSFISYLKQRYKITTVSCYEKAFLLYIYPLLQNKKISELNVSDIRLINERINSCQRKSVSSLISATTNFFKFLTLYDVYLDCNFIVHHKPVVFKEAKIKNVWTLEQFNIFLNVIDEPYFRLMFKILFYYGLRISELRGLKKECINEKELMIKYCLTNKSSEKKQTLTTPKSKTSYRTYPMLDDIYAEYLKIQNYENFIKSDFVFYSNKNPKIVIGETSIKRAIKHYSSLANLKPLTAHEFRHSCASYLINNKMDPLQVASWLGHSSPTITLTVYSHLYEDRKKEVHTFLNKKSI